jgi:hypothetical protein
MFIMGSYKGFNDVGTGNCGYDKGDGSKDGRRNDEAHSSTEG